MNKVMLFSLISLAASGQLIAQEGRHHAPSTVQHAFQRDYPEAGNPQWSSTNGQWSASFADHSQYDRGEMIAHYDRSGHHVDSHVPYDRNDVPQAVVEKTQRSYPDARDYNYTEIERPSGQSFFQVRFHTHGKRRTMYVDESGRERQYNDRH